MRSPISALILLLALLVAFSMQEEAAESDDIFRLLRMRKREASSRDYFGRFTVDPVELLGDFYDDVDSDYPDSVLKNR